MVFAGRKLVSTLAAAGVGSLMLAAPVNAAHEGSVYTAELNELNDSGASGSAMLTVSDDGETMAIDLSATGFDLDGPHAMHLHGIVDGDSVVASTCPTMADDADGDGVLTVLEGADKYGGVLVSLTTSGDTSAGSALAIERFPAGTAVDYTRAGIPIDDVLKPNVGKLHFVVHGIDENDNGTLDLDQEERSSLTDDLPREGTAPALCGTMTISAQGAIQTGAGGLADFDQSSTSLVFAGLVLAGTATAMTAARRRRTVPTVG